MAGRRRAIALLVLLAAWAPGATIAWAHGTHAPAEAAAMAPPPVPVEASLYEPALDFSDESGQPLTLRAFAGSRVLLSLFYTTCYTHVCSAAVDRLKEMDAELKRTSSTLPILLVTLDHEWDDARKLAMYKQGYGLGDNWHLLAGREASTVALAKRLGYEYFEMGPSEIIHSFAIYVLDRDGRVERIIRWETRAEDAMAMLTE